MKLSNKSLPKIALVHDYLCGKGGTERVFQYMCEEFVEADVYTLAFNSHKTFDFFKGKEISTTWLNIFVRNTTSFKLSFPIATYVMGKIDLSQYDIVLSSSATVAKYVKVKDGVHVCYCYIPTRAIWHADEYFSSGLKAWFYKKMMRFLRKKDFDAAQRVDNFIAISNKTKFYINEYYRKESSVIPCPVNTGMFYISNKKENYYLLVSRMEKWKKVEYAIDAFNENGKLLHVIGGGSELGKLRGRAESNIKFLGEVDDHVLTKEYSEAKAVIFTPFLEYGLIPLEANASGTPVICYGYGGVTETMIPFVSEGNQNEFASAVFFYEQTKESLIQAVEDFEQYVFDSNKLKKHADRWSVAQFKKDLREEINQII